MRSPWYLRLNGPNAALGTNVDFMSPNPLCQLDGWTNDLTDESWMAEWRDFACRSASDNSDWELSNTNMMNAVQRDFVMSLDVYEPDEDHGALGFCSRFSDKY